MSYGQGQGYQGYGGGGGDFRGGYNGGNGYGGYGSDVNFCPAGAGKRFFYFIIGEWST